MRRLVLGLVCMSVPIYLYGCAAGPEGRVPPDTKPVLKVFAMGKASDPKMHPKKVVTKKQLIFQNEFHQNETNVIFGYLEGFFPKGTKIRCQWFYEEQPVQEVEFVVPHHTTQALPYFRAEPFPPGSYKLAIWINGEYRDAVAFSVVGWLGERTQPSPEAEVVARDGRFIAYKNGIVKDTRTGLEWIAGPDVDTDWYEANSWVESLSIDGGDWRMPTLDELKTLYQPGKGKRNMTPLLGTTSSWIWSGETENSSTSVAWRFRFDRGVEYLRLRNRSDYSRGFAVRSEKTGHLRTKKEKPEMAEIAAEKQHLHSVSKVVEIDRDGYFILYGNSVMKDTRTGLEWIAGPDVDTDWYEANSWVESLSIDGGDWRMPTLDELKTLYQPAKGKRNMTPLLKTRGWRIWSGETENSLSGYFSFVNGGSFWIDKSISSKGRAFGTRSRSN